MRAEYQMTWVAFRNFTEDRLEADQKILVGKLFTFYQNTKASPVQLEFFKPWLQKQKWQQIAPLEEPRIKPTIGLCPEALFKYYPYESTEIPALFEKLISKIEEILYTPNVHVELELKFFGKILKAEKSLSFVSYSLEAEPGLYRLPKVKTLIKRQAVKENTQVRVELPKIKTFTLKQEQALDVLLNQDSTNYQFRQPQFKEGQAVVNHADKATVKSKIGTGKEDEDNTNTKLRMKNQFRLKKQYATTTNPLQFQKSHSINDSIMMNMNSLNIKQNQKTAKQIFMAQVQPPTLGTPQLPKILDEHSQTKATPLTLVFNSHSASARIAVNYTPLCKYIHLDVSRKRITILYNNENNIFYSDSYGLMSTKTNNQANPPENNSSDNLKAVVRPKGSHFYLKKKFGAEKMEIEQQTQSLESLTIENAQRYNKFITEVIKNNEVVNFPKIMISKIKSEVKSSYPHLSSDKAAQIVDGLFFEIQSDFKYSLKKGVLDYILKERDECQRLGLAYSHETETGYSMSALNLKVQKGLVQTVGQELQKNLLLFSSATNQIIDCWIPLENSLLCNLEIPKAGYSLQTFIDQQRLAITNQHNVVTQSWIKKISEIYKVHKGKLKTKEFKIFCKAMGKVISSQIRSMVEKTLDAQREFFSQFDVMSPPNIQQALDNYYSPTSPFYSSFLTIRVQTDKDAPVMRLETEYETVLREIMEFIKDIVKFSENIARPENFFHRSEKSSLDPVLLTEQKVEEVSTYISDIITLNFQRLQDFDAVFGKFYYLLAEKNNIENFPENSISQSHLVETFVTYKNLEQELIYTFPSEIPMNMIRIDLKDIKEELLQISRNFRSKITDHVVKEISSLSNKIIKSLKSAFDGICTRIETVEKLIEAETWIENFLRIELIHLQDSYYEMLNWLNKMMAHHEFGIETFRQINETKQCLIDYSEKIEREKLRVLQERENFDKRLIAKRGVVVQKGADLYGKVEAFKKEGRLFWMDRILAEIAEAKQNLQDTLAEIQLINHEEQLLGYAKSEFLTIDQCSKTLTMLETFWNSIFEWTNELKRCESTVIFKLDIDKIEERIARYCSNIFMSIIEFRSMGLVTNDPVQLAEKILNEIEVFKGDFKLVKYICNEGLRPRHWKQINEYLTENRLDVKLEPTGVYYMSTLKDMNLHYLEQGLSEIADTAAKEYANERQLMSIEKFLDQTVIELKPHKEFADVFVFTSNHVEDLYSTIVDHLYRIQTMKSSKYAEVFQAQIVEIESRLTLGKEIIELWKNLQSQWIYLEPIFMSEDINKSLPHESAKFKETNAELRSFLLQRRRDPSLKSICRDNDQLHSLTRMLESLQNIDKNLENYLDKKRNVFPRFYFLSSEALIELLSNSKNPEKVQKFLKNLFDGISRFNFNSEGHIVELVSSEGEILQLKQPIDLLAYRGYIERWLSDLEGYMVTEVKRAVITGLQDYGIKTKEQFIKGRISQACVNAFMTAWSYETENAIIAGQVALEEHYKEFMCILNELTEIVKSDLCDLDRRTLESLLVITAHNRDVTMKLIESNVDRIEDFAWQSQLRYHWDSTGKPENDDSYIKMMYSIMPYGYEYYGNAKRLVITPITDRCFRSITIAVNANFGAIVEGPAATGKSETIKDFARTLARFSVVFNCSESMNYKSIDRMIKGMANTGGWCCLDEFNRLDLEVLSVISQHLVKIKNAFNEHKNDFFFEGSLIKFKGQCAWFATVNPGYTSRKDLPENLRVIFRPISIIAPDALKITEVKLFAAGFSTASLLAPKLINFCNQCKNFIPEKTYFDFSIRSIISIISSAQELKIKAVGANEEELIGQAVYQVIRPKFSNKDAVVFNHLFKSAFQIEPNASSLSNHTRISELTKVIIDEINKEFQSRKRGEGIIPEVLPSMQEDSKTQKNMVSCAELIKLPCEELPVEPKVTFMPSDTFGTDHLKHTPYFSEKVAEIYSMMKLQPGVVLLGDTLSAKSTSMTVSLNMFPSIEVKYLNPKIANSVDLFGSIDLNTNEWNNGVLSVLVKTIASRNPNGQRKVLVLDGVVESEWIESLNTLLDESRKLTLGSGDVYFFSSPFNVVFETDSLDNASPATVSRCGIVYFQAAALSWKNLMASWLGSLECFSANEVDKISIFFLTVYEPFLNSFKGMKMIVNLTPNQIFLKLKAIAGPLLKLFADISHLPNTIELKDKLVVIDQIMIFSIVWSMGFAIHNSVRKSFDISLKKFSQTADKTLSNELSRQFRKVQLPENGSLFDYQLIVRNSSTKDTGIIVSEWLRWNINPEIVDTSSTGNHGPSLIVPTLDRLRHLYLSDSLLTYPQINMLLVGPPATGKSMLLREIKNKVRTTNTHLVDTVFTSWTTATSLSILLDKNYTRKVGSKVLVPVKDKENLMLTVEDLNMGHKDGTLTQSALELSRFVIETKSFYELNDKMKSLKRLSNFRMIGTSTSHSLSNAQLPERLLSKFFVLPFGEIEDDQQLLIYNKLMSTEITDTSSENFISKIPKMASACVELLKEMKKKFLPIPSKSHYMFDLRNNLKFISGLMLTKTEIAREPESILKLWTHECIRTYMDQLNTLEDKTCMLNEILKPVFLKSFNINFDSVFGFLDTDLDGSIKTYAEIRTLIFGNLSPPDQPSSQNYSEQLYIDRIKANLKSFLDDFYTQKKQALNLVLFTTAVEQLFMISRILQQPGEGALLVGPMGSGRKSLLKFASYLNACEYQELRNDQMNSIDEFNKEMGKVISKAVQKESSTFVITENQINKNPHILKSISSFINHLNAAAMISEEDLSSLLLDVPQITPAIIEELSVEIKKRIHVFGIISSTGSTLKTISVEYPSLLSLLSVQWFSEWSNEALSEVAFSKLETSEDLKIYNPEFTVNALIQCHQAACHIYEQFSQAQQLQLTLTNHKFISFTETFKAFHEVYCEDLKKLINNYETGQMMIERAEAFVADLKTKLVEIQAEILEQNTRTEELLSDIEVRKKDADSKQKIISAEEAYIREQTTKLQQVSTECQTEIDVLQVELDKAYEHISKITKNDIEDLKQLKNPPPPIQYTLQALCIILGTKLEVKKDVNTSRMLPDWLMTSRRALNDLEVTTLTSFNNEKDMDESKYSKLDALFNDPKSRDALEENSIRFSSTVAAGMFLWIKGQMGLYALNMKLAPRREFLKTTEEELKILNKKLAEKEADLNSINAVIKELNSLYLISKTKKTSLEREYQNSIVKSGRAEKLLASLPDEKERWKVAQTNLESRKLNALATSIYAASFLTYGGPLDKVHRESLMHLCKTALRETHVLTEDCEFDIQTILSNPIQIREWILKGLPDNKYHIESAMILERSTTQTLIIDPHTQAAEWLRGRCKDLSLTMTKFSEKDWLSKTLNSMNFGTPLLIDDIDWFPEVGFDQLLTSPADVKSSQIVTVCDKSVELNPLFKLYLVARNQSISISDTISTQLTIINFSVTSEALTEQIITLMMKTERPELEQHYTETLTEGHKVNVEITKTEEKILEMLQRDQQNILEDESLIDLLTSSSLSAKKLAQKHAQAIQKESEIKFTRNTYAALASQCAGLFMAVEAAVKLNLFYKFQFKQFVQVLANTLKQVQNEANDMIVNYNTLGLFVKNSYLFISKSLFNADKLVFACLMFLHLDKAKGASGYRPELIQWLIRTNNSDELISVNGTQDKTPFTTITENAWRELKVLAASCPSLSEVVDQIKAKAALETTEESNNTLFESVLPELYRETLTPLEILIIQKILMPEKFPDNLKTFLIDYFGIDFSEGEGLDLKLTITETNPVTPIVFVTSSLKDPIQDIQKIAERVGTTLEVLSLGQGQKEFSFRLVDESIKLGHWLLFQNCHLAKNFWRSLMKKLEELKAESESLHKGFRIILVTYSTDGLPVDLIAESVKVIIEPPVIFKKSIHSIMNLDLIKSNEFYDSCNKKKMLQQVTTCLSFFHAVIIQRRHYEGLGWTANYNFNEYDLVISLQNIRDILHRERKNAELPTKLMMNFILESNYGARIFNDRDRQLIENILSDFVSAETINQNQLALIKQPSKSDSNRHIIPDIRNRNKVLEFIDKLPDSMAPEAFGLNDTAEFSRQMATSSSLQARISSVFVQQNPVFMSSFEIDYPRIAVIIKELIRTLPMPIENVQLAKKFPLSSGDTIGFVIHQEVELLNYVISDIKRQLEDAAKVCVGQLQFNDAIHQLIYYIDIDQAPTCWKKLAQINAKSIPSFITKLGQRIKQINTWITQGVIANCWLGGLYKPESFLLAILMSESKKRGLAISELDYHFECANPDTPVDKSSDGEIYIQGLIMQNAQIEYSTGQIIDSQPKVPFTENIKLKMTVQSKDSMPENGEFYSCPLYKSTSLIGNQKTGQAKELLCSVRLPSSQPSQKWLKNGVALFTQIEDA